MSASEFRHHPVVDPLRIGWLPRDGLGNGLDADAWAPVLDLEPRLAVTLLDLLATAGVPAYTASIRATRPATWRLWVATGRYATAEGVFLREMPDLLRERPAGLR
jgi:hypothetical protein